MNLKKKLLRVTINLPIVGFSQAEFILDFIKVIPGIPKADVKSRLIMSPMHTKNLLLLLNAKIKEYEKKFAKFRKMKKKLNLRILNCLMMYYLINF